MTVRVRYAPSPTGSPHVGNVRTAIYCWLLARKEGGQFLARLEDTDRTPGRYVPEGIYDIEASLRYLGILPDEWWVSGGPCAPYIQSERLPLYQAAADRLIESGHAYRCYCSRARLEALRAERESSRQQTGYDRLCRDPERREQMRAARAEQEGGEPSSVVRLAMPTEGATVLHDEVRGDIVYENRLQDDQVLLKSDGFPTYFLACAVDDHEMGITHILRGDDWLSSAPKLVQVFDALGYPLPKFTHPPLIVGADRKKLSKRHGSTQFVSFMEAGYLPEALLNFLVLLGWSAGDENRELFTIPELIERFSIGGITDSPAVFDYEKLNWMNGHYIRQSPAGRIIGLCLPYLVKAGLVSPPPGQGASEEEKLAYSRELEHVRRVVPLEQGRMKTLSEIVELAGFFFNELDYPSGYDPKAARKWFGAPHLRPLLEREIAAWTALPSWTIEALEETTRAIGDALGVKFAEVIHPTRVAATGQTVGPGLFETLWALGRDRTLARLQSVLDNHDPASAE
ncbi:MAG TPA: glutamate--tRNA ligase [Chthonomonadaceae bacterium]|nr:glutamate--tRNA ligase [Chthonomonadaceae bacterium]